MCYYSSILVFLCQGGLQKFFLISPSILFYRLRSDKILIRKRICVKFASEQIPDIFETVASYAFFEAKRIEFFARTRINRDFFTLTTVDKLLSRPRQECDYETDKNRAEQNRIQRERTRNRDVTDCERQECAAHRSLCVIGLWKFISKRK